VNRGGGRAIAPTVPEPDLREDQQRDRNRQRGVSDKKASATAARNVTFPTQPCVSIQLKSTNQPRPAISAWISTRTAVAIAAIRKSFAASNPLDAVVFPSSTKRPAVSLHAPTFPPE
jgi:hypothetical protein